MPHQLFSGAFSRTPSNLRYFGLTVLLLWCAGVCHLVEAQSAETRPVARLITATPTISRPSRVHSDAIEAEVVRAALASPTLEEATPLERRAFEQTNLERAKNGLAPFVWDAALCRMARQHSEEMARLGYFSHADRNGLRLRERARAVGITHYTVLGENIAYNLGYDDPGAFAVERWMLSAGHRANILYTGFKAMAVGTFVAADGSVFFTQTFITR
jgi:uncharacterized protein YkwD